MKNQAAPKAPASVLRDLAEAQAFFQQRNLLRIMGANPDLILGKHCGPDFATQKEPKDA